MTRCPACGAKLTEPESVALGAVVASLEIEVASRLAEDGRLLDVDDLIENGYHSSTSCMACGEGLADYEGEGEES